MCIRDSIIIGALYPMSIAVDFQTDFITFGKEVIEFHHFDKDFRFQEEDLVMFISATGRTLNAYIKENKDLNICDANIVLMTQNAVSYTHLIIYWTFVGCKWGIRVSYLYKSITGWIFTSYNSLSRKR